MLTGTRASGIRFGGGRSAKHTPGPATAQAANVSMRRIIRLIAEVHSSSGPYKFVSHCQPCHRRCIASTLQGVLDCTKRGNPTARPASQTFPTSLPAQGAKWSDTGFDYYKTDQRSSFAEDVFESPDNRIIHFAKEQRARRKSASRSPRRFYQASHLQHRSRTLRSHIEEGRPAFTLSTKQHSPPLSQQPFPVPGPNPR